MDSRRTSLEVAELWERFHRVVNMTSDELSTWLANEPGLEPRPGSNAPSPIGEAVVNILSKRRVDVSDDDFAIMEKVVDVVEDETEGLSKDDVINDERRRHRLMNVGHDPFKEL